MLRAWGVSGAAEWPLRPCVVVPVHHAPSVVSRCYSTHGEKRGVQFCAARPSQEGLRTASSSRTGARCTESLRSHRHQCVHLRDPLSIDVFQAVGGIACVAHASAPVVLVALQRDWIVDMVTRPRNGLCQLVIHRREVGIATHQRVGARRRGAAIGDADGLRLHHNARKQGRCAFEQRCACHRRAPVRGQRIVAARLGEELEAVRFLRRIVARYEPLAGEPACLLRIDLRRRSRRWPRRGFRCRQDDRLRRPRNGNRRHVAGWRLPG